MNSNRKKANLIILIGIALLFILLVIMLIMIKLISNSAGMDTTHNITVDAGNMGNYERNKTVKEVIESYGSIYLKREEKVFIEIYVTFKYDLFDENGKSKKQYFYDIIEEIVEIEKDSFFLIDNQKNIEIYVGYDKEKETYKITINNEEDYFNKTSGDIYVDLNKVKMKPKSDFALTNSLLFKITENNMYYARTELSSEDRVKMDNGYYAYDEGAMIARLQKGRVLNIIFKEKYKNKIALNTYVNTPLEEVDKQYSNPAFGSVNDGYLGYIIDNAYIFLYEDEVSIYGYQYKANNYFDTYLENYCATGDLEKLYNDFTTSWSNYFENEYNPDTQSLKITFPTRGIEIDIEGNDSTGIKIYSNYYLTDTVKELIKSHKITLVADKDLIHITEQARRESSR